MRVALVTTVLAGAIIVAPSPGLATAAGPSQARVTRAVRAAERSPTLWATINICSSRRYPHTVGVRGQMPTLGFSASLSMTFDVDWYSTAKKRFIQVATRTESLGRASSGLQQDGAVFPFAAHTGLLRSTVVFTWTRGGRVLGQVQQQTTAGHKDADFGSPPRYSAAQCRIR
jgi:hypothetical protein